MPHSTPPEPPSDTTIEVTGRLRAVVIAGLASGPIFVALAIPRSDRAGDLLTWPLLWAMLSFASLLTTAPVALLAVGTATWSGGWLGAKARLFRHPLVWVAIGAVGGMTIAPVLTGAFEIHLSPLAYAIGGLLVASIARRFVAWID